MQFTNDLVNTVSTAFGRATGSRRWLSKNNDHSDERMQAIATRRGLELPFLAKAADGVLLRGGPDRPANLVPRLELGGEASRTQLGRSSRARQQRRQLRWP